MVAQPVSADELEIARLYMPIAEHLVLIDRRRIEVAQLGRKLLLLCLRHLGGVLASGGVPSRPLLA